MHPRCESAVRCASLLNYRWRKLSCWCTWHTRGVHLVCTSKATVDGRIAEFFKIYASFRTTMPLWYIAVPEKLGIAATQQCAKPATHRASTDERTYGRRPSQLLSTVGQVESARMRRQKQSYSF